jgi:DNA-binding response OmpR family regulator
MPDSKMTSPRVLVADDNRSVLLLLSHWLVQEGFSVQTCESGEEALGFLEREDFDVVILDWHMGGIEGPEVVRIIRERKGLNTPYVIMATGEGDENAIRTAFGTGVDDFVGKPLDQVKMLARMHAARRVISL